jgi:hypothetical protein
MTATLLSTTTMPPRKTNETLENERLRAQLKQTEQELGTYCSPDPSAPQARNKYLQKSFQPLSRPRTPKRKEL